MQKVLLFTKCAVLLIGSDYDIQKIMQLRRQAERMKRNGNEAKARLYRPCARTELRMKRCCCMGCKSLGSIIFVKNGEQKNSIGALAHNISSSTRGSPINDYFFAHSARPTKQKLGLCYA